MAFAKQRPLSRFAGHLLLRASRRADGRTILARQSFRAPFHLSKPYWEPDCGVLHVQVVNPTAGILAGDRLRSDITAGEGARLLVTTPSTSRIFRMHESRAESAQHFVVDDGSTLEVLPEPLVPHAHSRFRQSTTVEVATGGTLLLVDSLMPGRIAHGEAWAWDDLVLDLTVRLDREIILRERFAATGRDLERQAALAGFGRETCFANAVLIAVTPDDRWTREIAALHGDGLWAGISPLRRGGWTIRLVAPSSVAMRRAIHSLRRILASHWPALGCPMRRV